MPFKEFDVPGLGKIRVYKRRGARSLRLSLPAGNVARVTVPSWTPYQTGLSFALSKRDWISGTRSLPAASCGTAKWWASRIA